MLHEKLADFVATLFHEEENTLDLLVADKGLAIHQHHYQNNLLRALKNHYPMTLQLLGQSFFTQVANDYILRFPSLSPQLEHYGAYFFDFIAAHPNLLSLQYIVDIAKLEWICHELPCIDNTSQPDLSGLDLTTIDHDNLQVQCNPGVQLISSHYPLLKIIDYCQKPAEEDLRLVNESCHLLIIKSKQGPSFLALSGGEAQFVSDLLYERPLAIAVKNTLAIDESFSLDNTLIKLIALNVIHLNQ